MALSRVFMTPEIYYACTLHALTVETEEIVGLLVGKFEHDVAYVRSIMMMQRSDKRKDRVEISTEQLDMALMKAMDLSEKHNDLVHVIGWYHSHPHITVVPSHVDLRTQAIYETMDSRFVGVIVSVFNEDKNKGQEIQITCFQSHRREVPLIIDRSPTAISWCLDAVFELPRILSDEESATFSNVQNATSELLTRLQNESAYVSSMCHILKTVVNPLMLHVENRIKSTESMCKFLEMEKRRLLGELRTRNCQSKN